MSGNGIYHPNGYFDMENRYPNGYFDMENGIWIHHLIFRVSNFQPNHGWCMVCLYALYMYHWDQTNWRWKAESNLTKWVGVKIGSPKCPKGLSEFSSLNGWYMLGIYPMFRHTHTYGWYMIDIPHVFSVKKEHDCRLPTKNHGHDRGIFR